jgi:hypothetical protein
MVYVPDAHYVTALLLQLQREYEVMHRKIVEIESLRYYEDRITRPGVEKQAGIEVRSGLTADLIKSVVAALTANRPRVKLRPLRSGDAADANASKRERFWEAWLRHNHRTFLRLVDSTAGNGVGILKGIYSPWPTQERARQKGESDKAYIARMRALKRKWGPPYVAITPHPLTFYPRYGVGDRIAEAIEHGWRPKPEVYAKYQLATDAELKSKQRGEALGEDVARDHMAALVAGMTGQPEEVVRPLPTGADTSTMCLVTEYWNSDCYQVYVNRRLIYEEAPGRVAYFIAEGETTSSSDPDKRSLSLAENMRANEPVINRMLSQMADAAEMLVHRRATIELPESGIVPMEIGADNKPEPVTFDFSNPRRIKPLPPGARLHDLSQGIENVAGLIPAIDLILRFTSQHGVAPIFKGMPPGASGSGYRDNSLYLMAKAQFEALVDGIEECLADYIRWQEEELVRLGEPIYFEDLELKPGDVEKFDAVIEVSLDPALPQNRIAEGMFWADMEKAGYVDVRYVREEGLKIEQPDEIDRRRLLSAIQRQLEPALIQDVLRHFQVASVAGEVESAAEPEMPGPDGNPLAPSGGIAPPGGPGGAQQLLSALGGQARAGVARQPPFNPGTFPPQ